MDLITEDSDLEWQNFATPFTVRLGDDIKPSKSENPIARFRVGHSVIRQGSAYHCNFAGDDCWYVRVLPRINGVSASFGSTAGGQELIITGFGLNG